MDYKKLFLTYEGRITRKSFWLGTLALMVVASIVSLPLLMMGGNGKDVSAVAVLLLVLLWIAVTYPSICLTIKRYHDRGKSGWWIFIQLVPIIGPIWYLIEVGFLRGTVGPNAYGEDPLIR